MALQINETGVKMVVDPGAPGQPAPAAPPSPPPPSAAPLPPPPPPSPAPPPQVSPTIPANMPAWQSWAIYHYVPETGVKLAVDPDAPEPHAPAPKAGPQPGLVSRFVSGCVNRVRAVLKSIRGR